MNLGQLQDLTVSYLDDLEFGYFTRPQLKVWLNNAQRKVQRILIKMKQNYYLKCVSASTVANQCNLVLPDDFMIAGRVEIIISGTYPNQVKSSLQPITLNQQELLPSNPTTPVAYYFKKNNLCFAPVPDRVYGIGLTYSYMVTDMVNDTDVPDVPERYHELLAVYAAMDGFIKDDRDNAYLKAIAEDYIRDMQSEAQQRQEQTSREVVTMNDDFCGVMF